MMVGPQAQMIYEVGMSAFSFFRTLMAEGREPTQEELVAFNQRNNLLQAQNQAAIDARTD